MSVTLRMNNKEQELIRKKAVELNKKLIELGQQPIKDSELAHFVLLNGIPNVELDTKGKLKLWI